MAHSALGRQYGVVRTACMSAFWRGGFSPAKDEICLSCEIVEKSKKKVFQLIYIKWVLNIRDPNEYSVPGTFFFTPNSCHQVVCARQRRMTRNSHYKSQNWVVTIIIDHMHAKYQLLAQPAFIPAIQTVFIGHD